MKRKPDISGFTRPAKDPTAFLEGAGGDFGEKPAAAPGPGTPEGAPGSITNASSAPPPDLAFKPEPTVQKLFRLRWDTASALREAAARQSRGRAKRVTETEIVEAALRAHLKRIDS